MRILDVYCGNCATTRGFEQPLCQDGHGGDCDEWACTRCGGALLIAPFTPVRLPRRRRAQTRHAA